MTSATAARSLQIHTVLYSLPPDSIQRFMSSMGQAVNLAVDSGAVSRVRVAVGDCSPLRSLTEEQRLELAQGLKELGVDELTYTFFDANLGSAAGHNRLLERLDSDLVLILNPDTIASPYLIQELTQRLNDPAIGLVEGRQIPIEHPKTYDSATGETPWATTACALVPADVVRAVGVFDADSFFLYCDDVDFSFRIRLAGYRVIFHPPARVFHDKELTDTGQLAVGAAEEYYAAEAALFMAHKYSRPALLKTYLAGLQQGTDLQRRAAATFLARQAEGTLPIPIDPEHTVGEFDEAGNWARRRW
jgi:GT2 family glycosyltransferase